MRTYYSILLITVLLFMCNIIVSKEKKSKDELFEDQFTSFMSDLRHLDSSGYKIYTLKSWNWGYRWNKESSVNSSASDPYFNWKKHETDTIKIEKKSIYLKRITYEEPRQSRISTLR